MAVLLIACSMGGVASENVSKSENRLSRASLDPAFQLVEQAVDKQEIPGAVLLVAYQGKIVRQEAYGLGDVEGHVPFRLNTICWLASITKPVTVAAAMKLVDQGQLGLDDPVDKYLPEFKNQKGPDGRHYVITIRQLMSHCSGIQRGPPLRPKFFFEPIWLGCNLTEIVHELAATRLEFVPGQKFQYSNAALYILARIIEIQSGKPYLEFVKESLLEPLKMKDTYFIIPPSQVKRVAVVYRNDQGKRETFCRYDPTWKISMAMPDGGLFSTTGDMMKFAQMFLDNKGTVLSREAVKEMLAKQPDGWGLGWEIQVDGVFDHDGSSGTYVWADPKTGLIGILFCQLQDPNQVDRLQASVCQAIRSALKSQSPDHSP